MSDKPKSCRPPWESTAKRMSDSLPPLFRAKREPRRTWGGMGEGERLSPKGSSNTKRVWESREERAIPGLSTYRGGGGGGGGDKGRRGRRRPGYLLSLFFDVVALCHARRRAPPPPPLIPFFLSSLFCSFPAVTFAYYLTHYVVRIMSYNSTSHASGTVYSPVVSFRQ